MAGNSRSARGRRGDAALVGALASGLTVETAAVRAGISERTAYRRLADPVFRQQLQEARADMVRRMTGRLTVVSAKAVSTLQACSRRRMSMPAWEPP